MASDDHLKWFRFSILLRRPIEAGGTTLFSRSGYVVRITSPNGHHGWGEASPLPGFHGYATVNEIEDAITRQLTNSGQRIPSIDFAISTARFWSDVLEGNKSLTIQSIPCTALIDRVQSVDSESLTGFKNVKVKVGNDVTDDANRVKDVLAIGGDFSLRLDANRRWNADEATEFFELLGDYSERIEFIEEPCADPKHFESIKNRFGIKIAADESLQECSGSSEAVSTLAAQVDYLILKPTMIGSIETCVSIARTGMNNGCKPVVSSAYESGIGMMGVVFLCSELGANQAAAGIGTHTVFGSDTAIIDSGLDSVGIIPAEVFPPRQINLDALTEL